MARIKAAKPAALEARPAAVGKLFSETILRGRVLSLGREGSEDSREARRERSSRRQAWVRAPEMSWSEPLRVRESVVKEGEQLEGELVLGERWEGRERRGLRGGGVGSEVIL